METIRSDVGGDAREEGLPDIFLDRTFLRTGDEVAEPGHGYLEMHDGDSTHESGLNHSIVEGGLVKDPPDPLEGLISRTTDGDKPVDPSDVIRKVEKNRVEKATKKARLTKRIGAVINLVPELNRQIAQSRAARIAVAGGIAVLAARAVARRR